MRFKAQIKVFLKSLPFERSVDKIISLFQLTGFVNHYKIKDWVANSSAIHSPFLLSLTIPHEISNSRNPAISMSSPMNTDEL